MNIGWTTVPNEEDDEKLAREAVDARLAACVQIEGPIRSFYRWESEVTISKEYRLTIKFLAENTEKIEAWINQNHPYDIPEWLTVSADRVHPAYKKWAEADTEITSIKSKPNKEVLRLSKLGRSYLRKHLYKEAETVFLEALELDTRNPYILVGLGDTTREM